MRVYYILRSPGSTAASVPTDGPHGPIQGLQDHNGATSMPPPRDLLLLDCCVNNYTLAI
jgi:hypothetical protein